MDHPRLLSYDLLKEITNDFSEERKIGSGTYGSVYKGVHKDGETIAVKLLYDMPGLDDDQFKREFNNLTKLQDDNIVRLVGYCHEIRQERVEYNGSMIMADKIHRALCFEYAHNGSLHENLFDESNGHDWHTRYRIIKGICNGLKYLHQELKPPMYHLDIKPANVLLDENMLPRVADFGLSRLFGEEQTRITTSSLGTLGYLPPEYIEQNVISNKFDIFSLGVVIIKVVAGPKGHSRCADLSSQEFAKLVLKNWRARLEEQPIREPEPEAYCVQVKTCIEIALKCMQADRRIRPSINDIIDKMNQTENKIRLWLPYDAYLNKPFFASDISGLTRFEYNDLAIMTDAFSNHLGLGAFGMVYKGSYKDLNGYQEVAVKEIKKTTEGEVHDFVTELRRIGRTRHTHTNLIELKGWCCSRNTWDFVNFICCCRRRRVKFFLVFEFVPNANLEDHLHDMKKILPWQKRYQIIKGIGSALRHLHHECNRTVLHGDIKPSSVLLDFDFNAKLGGFGLSRTANKNNTTLVTTAIGTEGYMDPRKSDIYSFGIVLLEIACTGKSREQVWELYREEPDQVMEYADRRLGGIFDKSQMKRVIVLGLRCSDSDWKCRPFMTDAMKFLEDGIELPAILEIEERQSPRCMCIECAHDRVVVVDHGDGIEIELPTISEIEEQQGSRYMGTESDQDLGVVVDAGEENSSEMLVCDSLMSDAGRGGISSWLKGGIRSVRFLLLFNPLSRVTRRTWRALPNFNSTLTIFSEARIKKATQNFSDKLGEGSFGCVFKGALPGFSAVAVKKLKDIAQGEKQFRAEVQTIGILHHVNLVRLFGFCAEGRTRLLVYEYMENGSLSSHLFSKSSAKFTWDLRYHVALGTARGLAYLHEECKEWIIHCDMKPDNVLLDAEFCPKIADFGMAKLLGRDFSRALTTMRGTIGYLAPEWISGLPITHKADVYSYGMMLLEIISGRRNAEKIREGKYTYFPIFAAIKVNEGDAMCLLDRRLEGQVDTEQLNRACRIACWCIQDAEDHRPMMGQVVHMLEGVMEVEIPPIPRSLQNYVGMEDYSYSSDADSSL